MRDVEYGTTLLKILQDAFNDGIIASADLIVGGFSDKDKTQRQIMYNDRIYYFTKELQAKLEKYTKSKLEIGSTITITNDIFTKIKGASQFGSICGYAFEVAFWDSYCTAANLPYRDNPQCESKRARVNSFISSHPNYAKAMKEIIERQYILAREALLAIVNGSGRSLAEMVLKMSSKENAADDFILSTRTGDFKVYLDLKSLAAPRSGPAAWRHYSGRSDVSIGIMPLLTYIRTYESKYWLIPSGVGGIISDAKWAQAIYNNDVIERYFEKLGQKYQPTGLLRRYMTKGVSDPNYLKNKRLVVATRHYGSAKGYTLEMTLDMDAIATKIDGSLLFEPMTGKSPFTHADTVYRWYNAETDINYAAVGIAVKDIEDKGYYNYHSRLKEEKNYGIAQAFALGKAIAAL